MYSVASVAVVNGATTYKIVDEERYGIGEAVTRNGESFFYFDQHGTELGAPYAGRIAMMGEAVKSFREWQAEHVTPKTTVPCPKCQDPNEWNGIECSVCKYDIRLPWSVKASSDDGTRVTVADTYDEIPYGVNVEMNVHHYPHDSAMFVPAEALKFAIALAAAAHEAMEKNAERLREDLRSALPPF